MSKHYTEITKLLVMEQEHFEDEVRRLGVSTRNLSPIQMLQAIQHAKLRLGYKFSKEDFSEGKVGGMMLQRILTLRRMNKNYSKNGSVRSKKNWTQCQTLKTQFDAAAKEYAELPDDTPVIDLHKLAGLDFKKLPKMEKSGERMLHDVKEWTLHEKSSKECAVLPEDTLQRILVGACNQLEIACYVEQMALNLCWDAVKVIKAALAGMATTEFTNVLEAAFGVDENKEDIPDIDPTEKEEETEEIPSKAITTKREAEEEDQPSTSGSSSGKRSTRSSSRQPPVKKSRKQEKPTKSGPFHLKDATPIFPAKSDAKTYLHTRVPSKYISSRESGPFLMVAIYKCNYARAKREEGETPDECDVICQSRGQTSTHIQQHHLNICICCFQCGHRWWSAFEWKKHMKKEHSALEEEDWFVDDGYIPGSIVVKKEVKAEELMRAIDDDDE